MKVSAALIFAFFGFSSLAMAQGSSASAQNNKVPVEQYNYAMHLDVAKVVSQSEVANVCGVVPMRMTYDNSRGQRHVLAYQVIGSGCSND